MQKKFYMGTILQFQREPATRVTMRVTQTQARGRTPVIIIQKEGPGSSLEVTLELLEAWGARSVPPAAFVNNLLRSLSSKIR